MQGVRRFFVSSLGHSGSGWLCKILNSHLEVFCFHELECITYTNDWPPVFRNFNFFSDEEKFRNLMYVLSPTHRYGDIFKVVGAVCGGCCDLLKIEEITQTHFPTGQFDPVLFFLTRHPVSFVQSQTDAALDIWSHVEYRRSMEDWYQQSCSNRLSTLSMDSEIAAYLRKALAVGEIEAHVHLDACLAYVDFLRTVQRRRSIVPGDCLIRLEEVNGSRKRLAETLRAITGLDYSISKSMLQRVNARSGAKPPREVFADWSSWKRKAFLCLFDSARGELEREGYDLKYLTVSRKWFQWT
jgi:hypothetical protein